MLPRVREARPWPTAAVCTVGRVGARLHGRRAAISERLAAVSRRLVRALTIAVREYLADYCPQLAAAVSYHVLFSLFPVVIFLVALLGLVLQDEGLRKSLTDAILDALPLEASSRRTVEKAVDGLASPFSAVGLVGLFALLWSASGMMAAVRAGLNAAWNVPQRHPYVRGKLIDVLLVLSLGLLLLVSAGLTILGRVVDRTAERTDEPVVSGAVDIVLTWGTGVVAPVLVSFAVFTALYHLVPATRPPLRSVLPGAAVAAVAFQLAQVAFGVYVAYFGNYNLVYGSLGAVVGFLVLVYASAATLLFGAEVASAWPRAGPAPPGEEPVPLREQLRRAVRGLWKHDA
jgi:membrane protein